MVQATPNIMQYLAERDVHGESSVVVLRTAVFSSVALYHTMYVPGMIRVHRSHAALELYCCGYCV